MIRRSLFQSGGRAGGRARTGVGTNRRWKFPTPQTTTKKHPNFKKNTQTKPMASRKRTPLVYVPIDKALGDTASQYFKEPPTNYTTTAEDVVKMGKPLKVGNRGVNKGGRGPRVYAEYENIAGTNSTGFSNKTKPNPSITKHETSSGAGTIATAMGLRDHRTVMDTGYPLTRALRSVKKQNGTRKQVLYDTKVDSTTELTSPVPRSALNHSCGFNSTNLWMLPASISVTPGRLGNLVQSPIFDAAPADRKERVLLSTEYFQSELRLHNQSSFLPIKLKFMIIAHDNDANELTLPDACLQNAFNTTNLQKRGAIPNAYQHSDPIGEGSGTSTAASMHVDYSNKSRGLLDSPWFRAKHKVAKTISKTLGPGETWYIKHRHHTGSGMDYYAMLQDAVDSSIQSAKPLGYSYAVESCGTPCEALYRTNPEVGDGELQSYLGTSSGWYTSEFKCTIKYILAGTRANAELTSTGAPNQMHARVYAVDDDLSASKQEFHALPADITQNSNVEKGKVYIPVVTDVRVRSHDSKSGAGDDQ